MENNYIVYEMVDGERRNITICAELISAQAVALALASVDPAGDEYFVTSVKKPNTFVPGGGWYVAFRKNAETGKVETRELS